MIHSTRRIAAAAAAVVVLLVAVWYFAFWGPQNRDLSSAHTARSAAEQQAVQLSGQVAQLRVLVKQIPTDTARLAALEAALPDNPSLDTALKQLHQAATATGVTLTTVGPSAPPGTGTGSATTSAPGGPAITLNLTVTGANHNVMSFLTGLSSMSRVLVVDHLALSGTSQLSASIVARVFYAGTPTP